MYSFFARFELDRSEEPTENLSSTEIRYLPSSLLSASLPVSSRVVRYFRLNSSNISRGCLFIRHEKFSPLPLQAIRFNLVRVDSIRRVVWLNSFRDKSAERGRGRNTSDKPSKSLKRGNSRLFSGLLLSNFGIGFSITIDVVAYHFVTSNRNFSVRFPRVSILISEHVNRVENQFEIYFKNLFLISYR